MNAQLLPLPCGCVIDAQARLLTVEDKAECPWCGSSFDVRQWVTWMKEEKRPLWIVQPQAIVRFGDDVLELLGDCGDCGSHLVRKCGGDKFHLDVPKALFETLRN